MFRRAQGNLRSSGSDSRAQRERRLSYSTTTTNSGLEAGINSNERQVSAVLVGIDFSRVAGEKASYYESRGALGMPILKRFDADPCSEGLSIVTSQMQIQYDIRRYSELGGGARQVIDNLVVIFYSISTSRVFRLGEYADIIKIKISYPKKEME